MTPEIISGVFALSGAVIGGVISLAITKIDRRWERAKHQIVQLADQVSAYYQLEQFYKDELARVDASGRSAKTIMEEMRTRVSKSGEWERPSMTSLAAQKIAKEWR